MSSHPPCITHVCAPIFCCWWDFLGIIAQWIGRELPYRCMRTNLWTTNCPFSTEKIITATYHRLWQPIHYTSTAVTPLPPAALPLDLGPPWCSWWGQLRLLPSSMLVPRLTSGTKMACTIKQKLTDIYVIDRDLQNRSYYCVGSELSEDGWFRAFFTYCILPYFSGKAS